MIPIDREAMCRHSLLSKIKHKCANVLHCYNVVVVVYVCLCYFDVTYELVVTC